LAMPATLSGSPANVEMPAPFGVQGPGEITMASGALSITSALETLSFRCTTTSAPSPPR